MRGAFGLALACLLTASLAGCINGEERTQWAFEHSQIESLYDEGKTGKGVTIAILDTGIDAGHPAFKHLRDDDKDNGELIAFRDFITGIQGVDNAFDNDGHGTHVAGIVAAQPSGLGDRLIQGVSLRGGAPHASLVIARVCSGDACQGSTIPKAIEWAVNQGADVISLSLGANGGFPAILNDALVSEIEASINDAIARGTVVVASAGNDGRGADDVSSPGDIRDVIAVGAHTEDLKVAPFSQQGSSSQNQCRSELLQPVGRCSPNQKPELVAPGVQILSTWMDGTYATADGTSQATPFVASAAALLLEGRPELSTRNGVVNLKSALVQSARDLPGQETPHDDRAGYGMLQASTAMKAYTT